MSMSAETEAQAEAVIAQLQQIGAETDARRAALASASDRTLRPDGFDGIIGQASLKARLKVHIAGAVADKRHMEHVLLVGPPGTGKTTLASAVAGELQDKLVVASRPLTERELLDTLIDLNDGIFFADEIHRWTTKGQEHLLSLLETGWLETRWGNEYFPMVTVIAATTEPQGVIAPLGSEHGGRFLVLPFDTYSEDEMAAIVLGMSERAHVALTVPDCTMLGLASAGVPRAARGLVLAARDMNTANSQVPTGAEILAFCGVDPDGLTRTHRNYLTALAGMGQAGLDMMSTRLRQHPSAVRETERLLLDLRLIRLEPGGRTLTAGGRMRAGSTTRKAITMSDPMSSRSAP